MRADDLTDFQSDALTEVGSIGAGHAATALSQLVDHRIDLTPPTLDLLAVNEIPGLVGGPETLVAAVYDRLLGDIGGSVLFIADRASALSLVDLLRGHESHETRTLGDEEESLIAHAASLLIAAYVQSIARFADVNLLPGRPAFTYDMVGGILEAVAMEIGLSADHAVVIRTEFVSDGHEEEHDHDPIDAYLFFMPDDEGLSTLLGRLGVT